MAKPLFKSLVLRGVCGGGGRQLLSCYALLWVNQGMGSFMSLIVYPVFIFFMEGSCSFLLPSSAVVGLCLEAYSDGHCREYWVRVGSGAIEE